MEFNFKGDLPLTSEGIREAFQSIRESVATSLVVVDETMGEYNRKEFSQKVKLFHTIVKEEVDTAEAYYSMLSEENIFAKKFLGFLDIFKQEIHTKIAEKDEFLMTNRFGKEFGLHHGFKVIASKAILDAQTVVIMHYASELIDLAILIEAEEKLAQERENNED